MAANRARIRLTPEEAEFVRGVLAGMTYTAAYRQFRPELAENSAKKRGSELAKRPLVAKAIEQGQAAQQAAHNAATARVIEQHALTREWVLHEMIEVVQTAKAQSPYQGSTVVAALTKLGNAVDPGMFAERVEHTGKDGGSITVSVTRTIIRPPPATED